MIGRIPLTTREQRYCKETNGLRDLYVIRQYVSSKRSKEVSRRYESIQNHLSSRVKAGKKPMLLEIDGRACID